MCVHTVAQAKHGIVKYSLFLCWRMRTSLLLLPTLQGKMKHDHFLCRTENLFSGAVRVGEVLGVRCLERRGEMSYTLFVLYGQFYKVLHFPVFFLLIFLHASLHSVERENVATV